MESRVCPECKTTLGEYDGHFCSSCGEKLPEDLVVSEPVSKSRRYFPSDSAVGTKKGFSLPFDAGIIKKAKFLVIALVIGLMYFPLNYLYTKFVPGTGSPNVITQAPLSSPEQESISYNLVLKSAPFNTESFASHVPHDVDLYIEGVDFLGFVDAFVDPEVFGGPLIEKARILVEGGFAVFSISVDEGYEWAVILVPKDMDIAEAVVEDLEDSYWNFDVIGDYLVATNKEDLFSVVSDAQEGLAKNLLLNPLYVTEINKLPDEGQALFMFFNDRGIDAVNSISTNKLNEVFYSALESVLQKSTRYLVVDNTGE